VLASFLEVPQINQSTATQCFLETWILPERLRSDEKNNEVAKMKETSNAPDSQQDSVEIAISAYVARCFIWNKNK
jgi:hypothetical protein